MEVLKIGSYYCFFLFSKRKSEVKIERPLKKSYIALTPCAFLNLYNYNHCRNEPTDNTYDQNKDTKEDERTQKGSGT